MQNIVFYVAANSMLGAVKDYANARPAPAPSLVKGVSCTLRMRVFLNADGETPYPLDSLAGVTAWSWIMDSDFAEATTHKLQADPGQITVGSVTEEIDGTEHTYTEFSLPISDMATTELYEWLGAEESKSGLHGELVGADAGGNTVFVLQVKNFTVRNRIGAGGTPQAIDPEYLTEAQVRALVQGGLECQFSADGSTGWHAAQADADAYLRFRIAGDAATAWSQTVKLIRGNPGQDGRDSYCYVAYASDADGTGFSLAPSGSLKFRAEIHVDSPIASPGAGDFSSAPFVKYIGDDGAPAESAQNAYIAVSGLDTLYTMHNILRFSSVTGNTLALDFRNIMDTPGGSAVEGADGDMFTWEFHVLATATLTVITVGSAESTMAGINIPSELELVNGSATWHVFNVRGTYKATAVNKLALIANYAYSCEA